MVVIGGVKARQEPRPTDIVATKREIGGALSRGEGELRPLGAMPKSPGGHEFSVLKVRKTIKMENT